MQKYLMEVLNHIQYKILAGLFASIYSDELILLLMIFVMLEFLDIFSRWLCLSKKCFDDCYKNVPAGLYKYLKFIPQARRLRYIKSTGLRDGFCDKMIIYLLLLLLSALVDGAFSIVHIPGKMLLTTVTTVLSVTEALSILENLNECGVSVIVDIKNKFLKKVEK